MKNHIANSPGLRLLPLAAGLLALMHGSPANARGGADGTPHFAHQRQETGADWLAAAPRPHLQSLFTPAQAWRDCRTIVVRNCNDHGSGSLRDAVANAGSGDTVDLGQLHCSRITLTSGAIEVPVDDLNIQGSRHHALAIDGNHADRVLYHGGPTAGNLALSDLTITHGRNATTEANNYGGCILANGTLDLKRVKVTGCELVAGAGGHAFGGGVYAYQGLTVADSTISANVVQTNAVALGGGIFARGLVKISETTIEGNAAKATSTGGVAVASSGGIAVFGDLDMTDSAISGNTITALSAYTGGAYRADASVAGGLILGTLTLARSAVTDNVALAVNTASDPVGYAYAIAYAGGLRAYTSLISDSTISGNSTSAIATNPEGIGLEYSRGGGFTTAGTYETPVVRLTNSTVSGNSVSASHSALIPYSYARGGGFDGNNGTLDVENSTIAFNTAEQGAGIFQFQAVDVRVESTIMANNSFPAGGSDFGSYYPISVAGANNLIVTADASVTLPGGTLTADPRLSALADNGGPTLTHALRSGSPAINTGNNVAGLQFDQRGRGFPRKVGHATDIGAYEKR